MPSPQRVVMQGGRAKAYRPLPVEERRARLEEGLAAYGRGDFFLAHELLEPAWMGTDDLLERELVQGLIKLAAAYVHATRGNPRGVEKNLRGALARVRAGAAAGPQLGIDAAGLGAAIDERVGIGGPSDPPTIRRVQVSG
jgi:predicted metal-dependent hydrolase